MLEKLSETLFNLRREKGSTQKEVAQYAGITSAALSAYEKGTKTPQLETAVKLAEYYGVSLDYLCGDRENIKEKNRPFTRADAIRLISTIIEKTPGAAIDNRFNYGEFGAHYDTAITLYGLEDDWAYTYFEKYETLVRLYKSGDIDKEVLEAWKEKKLKEKEYQLTFDGYYFVDEELPF